jgi:hypothetical protein
MAKKTVPAWIQNPLLVKLIKSNIGIILSYWLFQGLLYMDIREKIFKISLDVFLVAIFYLIGVHLFLSIFIAHTANMFLNGHYHAMRSHMNMGSIGSAKFINYIEGMYNRLQGVKYLLGAAAYGSLSRNVFRSTSDIDIRVFPEKGLMNWAKAVIWVFTERIHAFINSFPLDLYAFDLEVIDSKMRADEPPIIFLDSKNTLIKKYSEHVLFSDFTKAFREKYVREKK